MVGKCFHFLLLLLLPVYRAICMINNLEMVTFNIFENRMMDESQVSVFKKKVYYTQYIKNVLKLTDFERNSLLSDSRAIT